MQKFDTRKIYKLSNEVIFFGPFFVCFSLFAFKLGATAMLCLRNWFIYQTGNKKLTGCQILCSCAVRFAAVLVIRARERGALPWIKMDTLSLLGFRKICVVRGSLSLPVGTREQQLWYDEMPGSVSSHSERDRTLELQLWHHEMGNYIISAQQGHEIFVVCELLMFYAFTSKSVLTKSKYNLQGTYQEFKIISFRQILKTKVPCESTDKRLNSSRGSRDRTKTSSNCNIRWGGGVGW